MSGAFLQGEGMYLRELRESDLDGPWYAWFNDEEVTRFQDKKLFPNSREKQREYYKQLQSSSRDVVLAIVEGEGQRHIGNVGLHDINWVHRGAELGIVIGDKQYWGCGFGAQAWRLITLYGFQVLNLHRITAWVMDGHTASVRCAEKAGFRLEGRLRDKFYKNGRYLDAVVMNILRTDLP